MKFSSYGTVKFISEKRQKECTFIENGVCFLDFIFGKTYAIIPNYPFCLNCL